ncbi:hypothetical protein [Salinicola halophilus]|uniref:hypothetical protein n=1 Tax=Salinicola halophilus TaxID=184065 RepID=UPI0013A68427|nr:hypothetical protein [Salinicola halophilus]
MDYALSDLLMFTPEVYLRLFVRANQSLGLWLAAVVAAIGAVALLLRRARPAARQGALMLVAAGWGLTAAHFLAQLYAPINWPVTGFVWAFALEGVLLGAVALRRPPAPVRTSLLVVALVALSILASLTALAAGTATAVALPGITPDMTAVGTVALLALLPRVWRWPLLVVPVLWCLFSALTHQALALWLPMAVPGVGLVLGAIVACWPSRSAARAKRQAPGRSA